MEFLHNLTNWIEEHYDDATSYVLEVCRDSETTFRTYKSGKVEDVPDPATAAETVYLWAQEFRANNADGKWRAMMRVRDAEGTFTKVVKAFFLPPVDSSAGNPFALSTEDIDKNPGLKVFMQLVDGERKRTESSLQISRMREDELFNLILEMKRENREDLEGILGAMRDERGEMREDMRQERKNNDDRTGPIIDCATGTLTAAAQLVSIHQDKATQVQLVELEHKAEKERWEMYIGLLPILKPLAAKLKKRRRKPADQEDKLPPTAGPTNELFRIIGKLSDGQIDDAKRIVGAEIFDLLDNAAHSGNDDQTTTALESFVMAHAKKTIRDPKGAEKSKGDLHALLGDELSKRFVALLSGDEPEEEPEDALPEVKPDSLVAGLRAAGLSGLSEEKQVAAAEQLGGELVGVLVGAAEGDEEGKAVAALGNLGARLNQLAEETSDEDAEKRLDAFVEVIGDTDSGKLVELLGKVIDKIEKQKD